MEQNTIKLSVLVCTHNPRMDYLERTLVGLKSQSLSQESWELIVIDNASVREVATLVDLSWHRNGRVVRENQLGLTYARHKAIDEAAANVFVFVDDDNVLHEDYLKIAWEMMSHHSNLGAIGGSCIGEYESELPTWFQPYQWMIGVREVDKAVWCNWPNSDACPIGAGMVIRKEVATHYIQNAHKQSGRMSLGRKGDSLMSGEDIDMSYCSFDLNMGIGVFPELKLRHLIPPKRVEIQYVSKLARSMVLSGILLDYFRGVQRRFSHIVLRTGKLLVRMLFSNQYKRAILLANWRGVNDAVKIIKNQNF